MTKIPTLPIEKDIVKTHLPHRDPMLFIDRVVALGEKTISTETFIADSAPFFEGHFPNMPIMPGVLIIETVAQAGALLVKLTDGLDPDKFIAFSHVDEVRFKSPVYPNETLCVDVEIVKVRGPFYKFAGVANVNGKKVASLKFAAAQMTYTPKGA